MRSTARLASLAVLLACVVLRAVVSYDPFPGWGDDPTRLPAAMTAIGPAESTAIDSIMLLAGVIVVCSTRARGAWDVAWIVLTSIGAAAAMMLGRSHAGDVDNLVAGLNWAAALFGGVAIGMAARDGACRRVSAAVLLGLVGLLAVRTGVQYFVENPQAAEDFQRSKAEILAAHGWTEGSPLARSFERRVSQPDAGGWFGLSNVMGSVAAGCTVAFLALTVRTWRALRSSGESLRDVGLWLVAIGLGASLAALACTMSKGAMMAAGGGVVLVAFAQVGLRPSLARALGIACIAGPVSLVVVRGVIGTRLGELSLLFRWFYMEGAARIIAGPGRWTGVGPAGFQDAYMLQKPAISPENVASPHSVLLDALAAFGVFGLIWCIVLVCGAGRAGRCLAPGDDAPAPDESKASWSLRGELRLAMAIAAVPTLLAAFIEHEVATEWSTAVRLVGLVLFALAASGVLVAMRRDSAGTRVALAAAALTVLAHAQIDMVGTTLGSSAWFFALLALAASGAGSVAGPTDESRGANITPRFHRVLPVLSSVVVIASLGWCVMPMRAIWVWQRELREAAVMVRPIPVVNMLAANPRLGTERERLREAADLLTQALGRPIDALPSAIATAAHEARITLVDRAIPRLAAACERMPRHAGTHRAASELMLSQGLLKRSQGDANAGGVLLGRAREVMEAFVQRQPNKATAWAWLGLLNRSLSESGNDREAGARAIEAYVRAAQADPHGVVNIPPLVDLLVERGRLDEARRWAAEGLSRDEFLGLDPLARLPEDQAGKLRAVAKRP